MKERTNLVVGIFITFAVLIFAGGLFLIGNQHKAFHRHVDFYTDFANVDGITQGAKVRVDGMDAGQVEAIQIPSSPSSKFRLKLQIDDRLHGLVRKDSNITIETEGIVGDKFLMVHAGTDQSPLAPADSTIAGKEPFEMSKLLEQASGIMNQANGTMVDVHGKLDEALASATAAIHNTDGLVTDIRHGHGTAGLLLEDPQTTSQVKQILGNSQQATQRLDVASGQVNSLLADFQSRQLFAQAQQTLNTAQKAVVQLDQASTQVNQTLGQAFATDQFGNSAGSNLQQSLTNVNEATGNLADDTEALKHEFFFRGFFKKRGYDSLDNLPVTAYRNGDLFTNTSRRREWLTASDMFTVDGSGHAVLLPGAEQRIDDAVSRLPNLYGAPIMIEGYAQDGDPGEQLEESRARAVLIRSYLELRLHLQPKDLGVIALSGKPPVNAGKSTWDGICLVQFSPSK